jgi:uncharacterized membrane protein
MRPNRSRAVALALLVIMVLPTLPLEHLGPGTAEAQGGGPLAGLLPQGITWQDWQATHHLYLHRKMAGGSETSQCPTDPATQQASTPGDRRCQVPMNTTQPVGSVPRFTVRSTVAPSDLSPEQQNVNVPETSRAWARLAPPLAHAMTINALSARVFIQFAGLTTCQGLSQATGQITVRIEARILPSGDLGETSDGQTIAFKEVKSCPVDDFPGQVLYPIAADLPLDGPVQLLAEQRLQLNVIVARAVAGNWQLVYDSESAASRLSVSSPDAFQFASWMEDAQRKVTTIFPIPQNPGDRFSSVGFLAFKTAFGGYDNPVAQSSPPQPSDGKWRMRILGPNGQVVSLRDPAVNPTPNEFKDCEGNPTDFSTCLDQAAISTDSPPSAKVFRMPAKVVVPGQSHTWNYTAARINEIAPGGGEFTLQVFGRIRDTPFESRLPEGIKFTVGGFGVRLAALRVGSMVETLSHTVRPGQPTTFLLNITNVAPKADNFTLSTEFLSCAPSSVPCSQWGVEFSGRDVRGQNVATLQGSNSSLLEVTLTPPAGASSASVRLRAVSQGAADQKDEISLSVQVSSTLVRGTGVFLFPDPASKMLRRGESQTFNYTIWNRGTDVDSFSVSCEQGPDLSVNPQTLVRNNDAWNGTIRIGSQTIGCRDANATRVLTATIAPGDVVQAQVTVQASQNAIRAPEMPVRVKAESQGDASKVERATATALLETRRSFNLRILTDGTANPEDPHSLVEATRSLRFGKDNPDQCSSPASNPGQACPGGNDEALLPGDFNSVPVSQQRLDLNFTEFAFYRVTLTNDGDEPGTFNLRLAEVKNQTIGSVSCRNDQNSFDASRVAPSPGSKVGMNDTEGVVLLNKPSYVWPSREEDRANVLQVAPGQSAVFYLRVHHEWNRYALSILNYRPGQLGVDGPICDSESRVTIQATAEQFQPQSVLAITQAWNAPVDSPKFTRSLVVTPGARANDGTYQADVPQACPPVTAVGSGDRVYCKYITPGKILDGCQCSVSWTFTADKFWGSGDDFRLGGLRRVGGLSLADLINRGWRFSGPNVIEENLGKGNFSMAVGDEIKVRVDVTVPANATINDFAGLQLEVSGNRSGASQFVSFYTVGAQNYKVNVTNLAGLGAIEIHPGDRAAINLNISNEGASVDIYNITVPTSLPQGYAPSFQPNETRVSPSRNKTVTVFIQSPSVGQFPQTINGKIRVQSTVNLTFLRGETYEDVDFQVLVKERVADNVGLGVQGIETRPINNGGSLTFTLNVTNPAPTERRFVLQRLPNTALVPEFVDGWRDTVFEPCFTVPARDAQRGPGTKQVGFSVTAPVDALEGTHVTYVLRVDEATSDCQPLPNSPNFAQALVTATVIGQVGLEVQALDPVKVVPRGGSVSLPVRVRNVGTAGDTFAFQAAFVNQSQAIPPNPWSAEVRTTEGQAAQTLFVDPQTSRIVFVNVSAPLDIPFTGVRSDLDFTVRGTEGTPASTRLTAFVQDYDIRVRIPNATVDAFPGQSLFFTLNLTNAGNGIDTHDILVDIGGLAGFWNVSSEFSAVTLLNGTSKDILLTVQVPRSPLPTTGAVIGVTVRSRQVEGMRPAAEVLGSGSPLVSLLNQVPKTALVSVNLFPYVSMDVDGDREPEIAIDRNRNSADGFEFFLDPFTAIIPTFALLSADGDGDGRLDHFLDIDSDGRPERYWDPDNARLTAIGGSVRGSAGSSSLEAYPDVNNDGTLEYLFDSDADLVVDRWIDPATRRTGLAIEKDFDDDGNPEFLIDTNGDGRPDKYFDPDRGARGLVTNVEAAPDGNPQKYAIDTTGNGRPNRVYDRVTGEVSTASFSSVGAFFADFWYLVLLFLAVAVLAGYLVWQRRKGPLPPGRGGA